jgi:hypothetical protein
MKFGPIVILALITLAIALPMMSAIVRTVAAAGTTCKDNGLHSCAGGQGDEVANHPGWHGSARFGDTKNVCKSKSPNGGCGKP